MRATRDSLNGQALGELREDLTLGIDTLEQMTRWMLSAGRAEIADGMAGATPFLRLMATTVGAWLMARQALAAEAAGLDDPYYAAKVATAHFFIEQILPTTQGLVSQITATAAPLYAIDADWLASS